MHIQNTGVRLKRRPPVVHTALTSAFQLFAEVKGPTITLTFKALKVNSVVYLFFWPFTSVMIKRLMCLLRTYVAVERVRERKKAI